MPIENWIALHDDSNPTALSRSGKICARINKAYERLEDSFITTFGAGKEFLYLQQKRIELELMYCKQIHTDDFSTQLFIDLLEDEISKLIAKKGEGGKIRKMIPWLEYEMGGMVIDTKKTTVQQFYERVNFIIEKNKK